MIAPLIKIQQVSILKLHTVIGFTGLKANVMLPKMVKSVF